MSRKDIEQKLVGAITDQLKNAGKSFWRKIFGPSDEDILSTITSNFIITAQEEKHPAAEIEEILLSVPEDILGTGDTGTVVSINRSAFSPKNLYRACSVGSAILNPRSLYNALHGLWRYAKIKQHDQDGFYGTDGRAHLILAITAMAGRVFSISDPRMKESWLNLLNIFLTEVMTSELVQSKKWNQETFFNALNNLKIPVKESIIALEQDRTKHEVRIYLNNIAEKTEACREYIRTVLPMLYKNESSVIIDGRPKFKDLDGTFISCLLEAAGLVLPEDKDYLDQIIEAGEIKEEIGQNMEVKKQEYIEEGTKIKEFMSTIMALENENNSDAKINIPGQSLIKVSDGDLLEMNRFEHERRHRTALFITALSSLINKTTSEFPRVELNEKSEIMLLTVPKVKKKFGSSFSQIPSKEEIKSSALLKSGIGQKYLVISTQQEDQRKKQKGEAAHRRKIMNFEVENVRIINAVSNLLVLCEKASKLYQHFGEAHGALLLQRLFPSIKILISASVRGQKNIEKICEALSFANKELGQKIVGQESFMKRLKDSLVAIEKAASDAHDRNESVLRSLINKEISLKRDLEEITNSLSGCTDLFIVSSMLNEEEEESLKKNIQDMASQLPTAGGLDIVYSKLAGSVRKNGILTIESFQKDLSSPNCLVPISSDLLQTIPSISFVSEFDEVLSAFKVWEAREFKEEKADSEEFKKLEIYIQSFGLELASQFIKGRGLCNSVFDQLIKNKKFATRPFLDFQHEILEYVFNHVEELDNIRGNLYAYIRKELDLNSEWINQTILKAIVKSQSIGILIINDDRSKHIYKHPSSNEVYVYIANFKGKFYRSVSMLPGQVVHADILSLIQISLIGQWNYYLYSEIQNLKSKEYKKDVEIKAFENITLTKEYLENLTSKATTKYQFLKIIYNSFPRIKLGDNYNPKFLCTDEEEAQSFFSKDIKSCRTYLMQDFKPHDFAIQLREVTEQPIFNENKIKLLLYRIITFSQLFYMIEIQCVSYKNKELLLAMVKKERSYTAIRIPALLHLYLNPEKGKKKGKQSIYDTEELDHVLEKWNDLLNNYERNLLENIQAKDFEVKNDLLSPGKDLPQISITNSSSIRAVNFKKIIKLCDSAEPQIKSDMSLLEFLTVIQKFFENLLALLEGRRFHLLQDEAAFKEKIVKIFNLISPKLRLIELDKEMYPLSTFFEERVKSLDLPDMHKRTFAPFLTGLIIKMITPFLEERRKECLTISI